MRIATSEVRMRAIQAYKSKLGVQQQVAVMYGIHSNPLRNWLRAYDEEDRFVPCPRGHMAQAFSDDKKARITILIQNEGETRLKLHIDEKMLYKCNRKFNENTICFNQYNSVFICNHCCI